VSFREGGLRRRRDRVLLDITPLIDCIFQLLIFFLLTASFVAVPNIRVELPRASGQAGATEQRDLAIVITREGDVQLESRAMEMADLRRRLVELARERPDARVLIQADSKAYHGRVVEVMDAAKAAGFTKLGVAIQRR
jgi:biopolymer transport protein ExbD